MWGNPFPGIASKHWLGQAALSGKDTFAHAVELSGAIVDIAQRLGKDLEDDTDPIRKQWMQDFTAELSEFIPNPKNAAAGHAPPKQTSFPDGASPSAKKKTPTMAEFFPEIAPGGAALALKYGAPAAAEVSTRSASQCLFSLRDAAGREEYKSIENGG